MCYKERLPITPLDIKFLNECIVCEIAFQNRKCFLVLIYRSPSQTSDQFDIFLANFENLVEYHNNLNPYLLLVKGDFNARCSNWWANDINTVEGT